MSDCRTASLAGPLYVDCAHQSVQNRLVCAMAALGDTGKGATSCDGYQVRTNGTSCDACTSKVATVVMSWPVSSTLVRNSSESGPPVATSASFTCRTHGVTMP